MPDQDQKSTDVGDVFKHLGDQQRAEAEETLLRYLGVIKRIYEHIAVNNPDILTELRRRARLRRKGKKARR